MIGKNTPKLQSCWVFFESFRQIACRFKQCHQQTLGHSPHIFLAHRHTVSDLFWGGNPLSRFQIFRYFGNSTGCISKIIIQHSSILPLLGGGNSNIFGMFTPKIEEDEPILTHIFQMGWNHQLVMEPIKIPSSLSKKLLLFRRRHLDSRCTSSQEREVEERTLAL